jgi:hypothetical protein
VNGGRSLPLYTVDEPGDRGHLGVEDLGRRADHPGARAPHERPVAVGVRVDALGGGGEGVDRSLRVGPRDERVRDRRAPGLQGAPDSRAEQTSAADDERVPGGHRVEG